MKSKRHVFLNIGMTSIEYEQFVKALNQAPEAHAYPRELAARLAVAERASDPEVLWSYEEDSPAIQVERGQCEEEGCTNPATDDDEAPEGLCQTCRDQYEWVPGRVGQEEPWGWVKREPVK